MGPYQHIYRCLLLVCLTGYPATEKAGLLGTNFHDVMLSQLVTYFVYYKQLH